MRVMLAGLLVVASLLSAQDEASQRQFGGTYDLLEPGQRLRLRLHAAAFQ